MEDRLDRFAAIADIHGNSAALKAVLDDIDALGITHTVNLGDHFSGPLDAEGTADVLIERQFPSILGNHDRWLLEQSPEQMGPSDRVAYDLLSDAHMGWLQGLPATLRIGDVFVCHGTPLSDTTYWMEEVREDAFVGMASRVWIEDHAGDIDASLILCGHTHTARAVRLSDGRLLVNPGSVGCPGYDDDTPRFHEMQSGTPAAAYAILARCPHGWDVTFRQIPYDTVPMVALARQNGRAEWARAIETGWVES
ncbi:MAG: metallophosphoesterase family protein [Pseudomonadota bacterium]